MPSLSWVSGFGVYGTEGLEPRASGLWAWVLTFYTKSAMPLQEIFLEDIQ